MKTNADSFFDFDIEPIRMRYLGSSSTRKTKQNQNFSHTSVGLIKLKQKFSGISSKNVLNLVSYPILLLPEGLFWRYILLLLEEAFQGEFW